jgi:hypothetical protein
MNQYYVLDVLNTTQSNFVVYNPNWRYIKYKTMPINSASSIKSINNELFVTAYDGIYKIDKLLNILESYNRKNATYKGIYYNYTADAFYVTSQLSNRIDLFHRNLSFISSISFIYQPYAITEKNGKLYVGLAGGVISVLENNLVVKNITTLCNGTITSIVIDTNELMGVLCWSNSMLYLYSTNGSYTGKNMTTQSNPRSIIYDLNGYFIIAGQSQINLYY